MRIAVAQFMQESDTFNPVLTHLEDFQRSGLFFGNEILQAEKTDLEERMNLSCSRSCPA